MQKKTVTLVKKAVATVLACSLALALSPVVKVDAKVKAPTLKKTLYITEGTDYTLKVKKGTYTIKSIKWTSSKPSVATVSKKGKVTAVKEGNTTIKAVVTTKKTKKKTKKYTLKCKVTVEAENLEGGWEKGNPTITEEHKEMVNKVLNTVVGVSYEPVALLGTQVVAGTNYRFLCKKTAVSPAAKSTFSFVDIYKDLDGNLSLLQSDGFDGKFDTSVEAYPEGWSATETPVLLDSILPSLQELLSKLKNAKITPVASVQRQMVSAKEYNVMLVCEHVSEVSDAGNAPSYCFVYINVKVGEDGTFALDVTDNKIVSDNGALS